MLIEHIIDEQIHILENIKNDSSLAINQIATALLWALERDNTVYFMGNGGSAADSQHLAAELVGRFQKERGGLPAIALTTDTSILTAVSNDYGFEDIFVRQVEALVKQGDVVVGISTSGNSTNVIKAMELAKEKGAVTVAFTGKGGGQLADMADYVMRVPSDTTARIQEAHILIGHIVCEIIDRMVAHVQQLAEDYVVFGKRDNQAEDTRTWRCDA